MSSSLHQFQLGTSRPRTGGFRDIFYFPPQHTTNTCQSGKCVNSQGHECPVQSTFHSKPICPSGCMCSKQK